MAGEFGQKPQERGLRDVESVQAPVQEQATPGIVQGVLDWANAGVSAFNKISDYRDKQEADSLAAQEVAFSNEYSELIDRVSAARTSRQFNETQARTALTMGKRDLISRGASADSLMDTEIKALKTVAGMALIEETPEEAAEKASYKRFAASKYFEYDASKEKQEENRYAYEEARTRNKGLDLKLEAAQLAVAKKNQSEAERAINEAALVAAKKEKLNNLNKDLPFTFHNQIREIELKVEEVAETQGQAAADTMFKQLVDQARNSHINQFSNIASQTEDGVPTQYRTAVDTVNRLANSAIKYRGSTENAAEAQSALTLAKTNAQISAIEDIEVLATSTVESLVPGSAQVMQAEIPSLVKSAKEKIRNAQDRADGDAVSDLSTSTKEGKDYRTLVNGMLENVRETDSNGNLKADPKVVGKNVSAYLAHLAGLSDGTGLKEMKDVVSFLANPDFAAFVQSYPGEIGARDMAGAQQALINYQDRVAQSTVNLLSKTISAEEKSSKLGKYAGAHAKVLKHQKPTNEGLDIRFVNGQVVVVATAVGSRQMAKDLTEKVNQPLTEAINASAAISKQSAESIFKEWLPHLWPSKYGEEPTQEEVQTQSVDYSQYEGRTGRDQEGNTVTVRNGVLVKVGGTTDAREPR